MRPGLPGFLSYHPMPHGDRLQAGAAADRGHDQPCPFDEGFAPPRGRDRGSPARLVSGAGRRILPGTRRTRMAEIIKRKEFMTTWHASARTYLPHWSERKKANLMGSGSSTRAVPPFRAFDLIATPNQALVLLAN